MIDRVVDITDAAVFLRSRNGLLVIEVAGEEREAIPFADLAAVVVANQQAGFTQGALTGLAEAGASLVTCDAKHHPAAMLVPLVGHYAQADRFAKQAALGGPKKKRWWQAVVRAKIGAQAHALERLHGMDYGVGRMAKRVGSGDPANVEAQAARRYWTVVFGDAGFRRGDDEDGRNALLNYGYAILRAATARALCASGLHPSFGLHHKNKLNAFPLADDMMEPFRPVVDFAVARHVGAALDAEAKRVMIGAVAGRYLCEEENRTLFDILNRTAQGMARAVMAGDATWAPARWEFPGQ